MKHSSRKFLLSGLVVLTFIAYSYQQRHDDKSANVSISKSQDISSAFSSDSQSATASPGTIAQSGKYKDGSYTGSSEDAFYGFIQVKAIVQGGSIVDVQFLRYPNAQPNSVSINQQAMPVLKQEAIKAQSSKVDIVSGATDSAYAFIESLKSALDKART